MEHDSLKGEAGEYNERAAIGATGLLILISPLHLRVGEAYTWHHSVNVFAKKPSHPGDAMIVILQWNIKRLLNFLTLKFRYIGWFTYTEKSFIHSVLNYARDCGQYW